MRLGAMKTLRPVALRAGIIIAAWYAGKALANLLAGNDADPLGLGLAAFAALVVMMGLGGVYDGWHRGIRWGLWIWLLSGLVVTTAVFLIPGIVDAVRYPTTSRSVAAQIRDSLLIAAMFTPPGMVGALIGGGFAARSSTDTT